MHARSVSRAVVVDQHYTIGSPAPALESHPETGTRRRREDTHLRELRFTGTAREMLRFVARFARFARFSAGVSASGTRGGEWIGRRSTAREWPRSAPRGRRVGRRTRNEARRTGPTR